jgi:hypothetical protein
MRTHRSLRAHRDPRPGHHPGPGRRTRAGRLGPALALALLVGCAALAGCSAGSHAAASASPTAMSDAQMLDIGRQFSQCVRDHGVPGFPDPVINDGHLGLPANSGGDDPKQALANNEAARQACTPILDRLPATAHQGQNHTPSPQEMQQILQFAQCMRENGIPEWPDPIANGDMPLPTPLQQEGKSARVVAGLTACNHLLPQEQGSGSK